MIKLTEVDKRQYQLTQIDENGNETVIHNYNLIYSPGSNKYNVLFSYVENMCNTLGKECEDWYINLIKEYSEKQDFVIIKNNIDQLKNYLFRLVNYATIALLSCMTSRMICGLIQSSGWITIFIRGLICCIVPNFIFWIVYRNTLIFKQCVRLADRITKKMLHLERRLIRK